MPWRDQPANGLDASKRKAQRCNKIDWPSVGADRPNAPDVPVSCS